MINRKLIFTMIIATAAATAVAQTTGPVRAEWNVREHLRPAEVIVQSHRGANALAPENTIEAYELGWKFGTYPETDVRATSDGVIVTFHDSNFKRLVKNASPELAKKGVEDVTFDELKKLDIGSWMGDKFVGQHVPALVEIFRIMKDHPDRHLYLDIKKVDLEKLADLVKKYGISSQIVLASPRHDELIQWKKMVPESDTLLWLIEKTEAEQRKKFEAAKARDFAGITQLQIHTYLDADSTEISRESLNPFTISDEFLISAGNTLRAHNITFQTLPHGSTKPDIYWKLLDLGLMSFATDHAKITRKAIEDYYNLPDAPNISKKEKPL